MTWKIGYDRKSDETVIKWIWDAEDEERVERIDGQHNRLIGGQPKDEKARETVAEMIQEAGTPERIRMHRDGDYPFELFDPS